MLLQSGYGKEGQRVKDSNPKLKKKWRDLIQRLKLPPKMIVFAQKLCKGWLSSSLSLFWRGMNDNTVFFRCGMRIKSIYHAIWGCRVVKDVWNLGRLNHVLDPIGESDLVGFLMRVSKIMDYNDFLMFITLAWQVWNSRNSHFYGEVCPNQFRW